VDVVVRIFITRILIDQYRKFYKNKPILELLF